MNGSSNIHIGIIKNNIDPQRLGRVQVYIAGQGGLDPDSPTNWKTVSYCPVYYGRTPGDAGSTAVDDYTNKQSYGMWFVTPDIGVKVLCILEDDKFGFWFACVPDVHNLHMIPAIGGSPDNTPATSGLAAKAVGLGKTDGGNGLPVIEWNDKISANRRNVSWMGIKKPVHEKQAEILLEQGLEKDPKRGVISSSIQRETPSAVFGISTPGRTDPDEKTRAKTIPAKPIKSREGGHTFVMDDGDVNNKNQMFRLRSASGHQLMMNDTEEIVYIGNAKGTVWLQFHNNGELELYSEGDMSIRTKGNFELHADQDMNVNVGGVFKLNADNGIELETAMHMNTYVNDDIKVTTKGSHHLNVLGETNTYSVGDINNTSTGDIRNQAANIHTNSGAGTQASEVFNMTKVDLADTSKISDVWTSEPAKILQTIVSKAPTHEPFADHS
jgi:hypothetical protein